MRRSPTATPAGRPHPDGAHAAPDRHPTPHAPRGTKTSSTGAITATSSMPSHAQSTHRASSSKTPARRRGRSSFAVSPNATPSSAGCDVVAIHEAYRLSAIDRRDARLERLRPEDGNWHELIADPRSLDQALEALEALRALASLPERRRNDLALKVAGYSYEEIRAQTPGRTRTNVNKSLVKARARIRRMRPDAAAGREAATGATGKRGPNRALDPLVVRDEHAEARSRRDSDEVPRD